jgi:hypothetical protein
MQDQLDRACVVMTDQAEVADTLQRSGFKVETLPAGWRKKVRPFAVLRPLLSGRLAEARDEHADKGYFAVAPDVSNTACNASFAGGAERPAG